MAEKCEKDCLEISELKRALFGSEGSTGVVGCLKKKVSWQVLGGTVLALIGVLTTVVLYAMAGEKKQNEEIAKIQIVNNDVEHVKEQVDKIEAAQQRIETQQHVIIQNQITPKEIAEIIKEAIKE